MQHVRIADLKGKRRGFLTSVRHSESTDAAQRDALLRIFADMFPPADFISKELCEFPAIYTELRNFLDSHGANMQQHSSRRIMITLAHNMYEEQEDQHAAVGIVTDIMAAGRRIRTDLLDEYKMIVDAANDVLESKIRAWSFPVKFTFWRIRRSPWRIRNSTSSSTSRAHSTGAAEACALAKCIGSVRRRTRSCGSDARMKSRSEEGSTVISDPESAITAALTAPLQKRRRKETNFDEFRVVRSVLHHLECGDGDARPSPHLGVEPAWRRGTVSCTAFSPPGRRLDNHSRSAFRCRLD